MFRVCLSTPLVIFGKICQIQRVFCVREIARKVSAKKLQKLHQQMHRAVGSVLADILIIAQRKLAPDVEEKNKGEGSPLLYFMLFNGIVSSRGMPYFSASSNAFFSGCRSAISSGLWASMPKIPVQPSSAAIAQKASVG